jgi:hypothetical protein
MELIIPLMATFASAGVAIAPPKGRALRAMNHLYTIPPCIALTGWGTSLKEIFSYRHRYDIQKGSSES